MSGPVQHALRRNHWLRRAAALILSGSAIWAGGALAGTNVPTYHGDKLRTGWNNTETYLTPSVVGGANFGLLAQESLDDQVDAQPLVMTNVRINGGQHDVVYVATESNSIYAFDAASGALLQHQQFGTPVSINQLPGGCNNNGNNVGINSTPVIDPASKTLYFIAYTSGAGGALNFVLHAVDLGTLADKVAPVTITASHLRVDGQTRIQFDPTSSRQRAGLLEVGGNIYAGFASFCDFNAGTSRGWLLGWNAGTLTPLANNDLTNRLVSSQDNFFLTSIWMSGYGLASSGNGYILYVTGNSDYSGNSYSNSTVSPPNPYNNKDYPNLAESIVEESAELNRVATYLTPSDHNIDVASLDKVDEDFGSGGVMIPLVQPGANPYLAVAAGKAGILYLVNRNGNMGGYTPGHPSNVLDEEYIGGCWCGPSYFTGSDGIGRIVASGGSSVGVWQIQTSPTTKLVQDPNFTSPSLSTGQDPGFFTTVSSNGTTAGSAVIWAVSRPTDNNPADIQLYAFDASSGAQLFNATAGTWPNTNGNANLVPTVANGRVYVASYQSLTIFGTSGVGGDPPAAHKVAFIAPPAPDTTPVHGHRLTGIVRAIDGSRLSIETRDGKTVTVDDRPAAEHVTTVKPIVGKAVQALGDWDKDGVLQATSLQHAKPAATIWLPDR